MATTRADQAEKTRQAVVETARTLFVERGFDATSLQLIADTMGVTKANVYYYFRTKADILQAVLAPSVVALETLLDEAAALDDFDDRLDRLIDGFVDQVVLARRTLVPMSRVDPITRRHKQIGQQLDELALRGLRLLFGDHPTPDQTAAYWAVSDLRPVTRHFADLPDDELQVLLKRLCLRTLRFDPARP